MVVLLWFGWATFDWFALPFAILAFAVKARSSSSIMLASGKIAREMFRTGPKPWVIGYWKFVTCHTRRLQSTGTAWKRRSIMFHLESCRTPILGEIESSRLVFQSPLLRFSIFLRQLQPRLGPQKWRQKWPEGFGATHGRLNEIKHPK